MRRSDVSGATHHSQQRHQHTDTPHKQRKASQSKVTTLRRSDVLCTTTPSIQRPYINRMDSRQRHSPHHPNNSAPLFQPHAHAKAIPATPNPLPNYRKQGSGNAQTIHSNGLNLHYMVTTNQQHRSTAHHQQRINQLGTRSHYPRPTMPTTTITIADCLSRPGGCRFGIGYTGASLHWVSLMAGT